MKKKYIAPSTQVINIQPSRMIASSVNAVSGGGGVGYGGDSGDHGVVTGDAKGRDGYDDDWSSNMW